MPASPSRPSRGSRTAGMTADEEPFALLLTRSESARPTSSDRRLTHSVLAANLSSTASRPSWIRFSACLALPKDQLKFSKPKLREFASSESRATQLRLALLTHVERPERLFAGPRDHRVGLSVVRESAATVVAGEDGVLHLEGTSGNISPAIPSRPDRKTLAISGGYHPRDIPPYGSRPTESSLPVLRCIRALDRQLAPPRCLENVRFLTKVALLCQTADRSAR